MKSAKKRIHYNNVHCSHFKQFFTATIISARCNAFIYGLLHAKKRL